jgi:hypothetical protein
MNAQAPCDGLATEVRVQRLADWLRPRTNWAGQIHRDFNRGPAGTCQLCGATLPVAVRALRFDEATATFECREGAPNSPELQAYFAMPPEKKAALEDRGWFFVEQAACPSLDEQTWNAAQAINLKRRQEFLAKAKDEKQPKARGVRSRTVGDF